MLETDAPHVLAVDDDPMALALLSKYLEDAGYGVVKARNGKEALHIMLEGGSPIVVTDWNMPEMDGLQATRQIKAAEETQEIPVIAFTSNSMPDEIQLALEAGCDGYLTKPLDPQDLAQQLKAYLLSEE